MLPARSLPSPRIHWRNLRRVRRRASGPTVAYNLRFPGQIFDGQGGLHYNYFRDYDAATGRYIESDPIGIVGLNRIFATVAKQRWMRLTGQRNGSPPLSGNPQTNTYDYGNEDPLDVINPQGQFGVIGWVAIAITAVVAGEIVYSIYKCAQACDSSTNCPYPKNSGDPIADQGRNTWVLQCKLQCVKSFGEAAKVGPW